MPNKARPRCPECGLAMAPTYRRRVRGEGVSPVPETFYCLEDDIVARGRRKPKFV